MRSLALFAIFGWFTLAVSNASAAAPMDFSLESVTSGPKFTLSSARGKYVALHFLLKTQCPFCLKHTRDYAQKKQMLPDVEQVLIKPDTNEEIRQWAKSLPTSGPLAISIYRDPDAALAKQYDIPDGYAFHGQTVHYPALVLLDPQGKEVFRYVGKSNQDRYSFEQLQAKIAELKAGGH